MRHGVVVHSERDPEGLTQSARWALRGSMPAMVAAFWAAHPRAPINYAVAAEVVGTTVVVDVFIHSVSVGHPGCQGP